MYAAISGLIFAFCSASHRTAAHSDFPPSALPLLLPLPLPFLTTAAFSSSSPPKGPQMINATPATSTARIPITRLRLSPKIRAGSSGTTTTLALGLGAAGFAGPAGSLDIAGTSTSVGLETDAELTLDRLHRACVFAPAFGENTVERGQREHHAVLNLEEDRLARVMVAQRAVQLDPVAPAVP